MTQISKVYNKKTTSVSIDINKLRKEEHRKQYCEELEKKYMNRTKESGDPQENRNFLTKTCIETAEVTVGKQQKNTKKSNSPEIQIKSQYQQKLRNDINACTDKNKRNLLRKERSTVKKEIKQILIKEEEERIDNILATIERGNDSNKMYKAVQSLSAIQTQKKLIVNGKNGI